VVLKLELQDAWFMQLPVMRQFDVDKLGRLGGFSAPMTIAEQQRQLSTPRAVVAELPVRVVQLDDAASQPKPQSIVVALPCATDDNGSGPGRARVKAFYSQQVERGGHWPPAGGISRGDAK
jgi:hypothetical protein